MVKYSHAWWDIELAKPGGMKHYLAWQKTEEALARIERDIHARLDALQYKQENRLIQTCFRNLQNQTADAPAVL